MTRPIIVLIVVLIGVWYMLRIRSQQQREINNQTVRELDFRQFLDVVKPQNWQNNAKNGVLGQSAD